MHGRTHGIDILRCQNGVFCTKDYVIALETERDCDALAEEDKGEDVPVLDGGRKTRCYVVKRRMYLLPAFQIKGDGVLAIPGCRSEEGYPMEDQGRRGAVTGKLSEVYVNGDTRVSRIGKAYKLPEDVEDDCDEGDVDEGNEPDAGGE